MSREQLPSTEGAAIDGAAAPEPADLEELAARLDSIVARASRQGWRGWTEEDARAVAAAAREIRALRQALAEGMREAFAIGREHGRGEELLDRLNREIEELSSRLARQAWGRGEGEGRSDGRRSSTGRPNDG